MSDDLDALLTRADSYDEYPCSLMDDLAEALRALHADYTAALDVIGRLSEGWDPHHAMGEPGKATWEREPILADDGEPLTAEMSDREWRVYCDAARQATHRNET